MIPLNYPNQILIQNQPQNTEDYNSASIKSFISHQMPISIPQKIEFPIYSPDIKYSLTFPRNKNIPNIPGLPNNYIPPIGTRLPLEKDHHPFKYFNINNDNNDNNTINKKNKNVVKIKEVSEFNLPKPEKAPDFIPGTHYEIPQYVDFFRDILQQTAIDEDLIVKIIENTYNKDRILIRRGY